MGYISSMSLSNLPTELPNTQTSCLSTSLPTATLLELINSQDCLIPALIATVIPTIATVIDVIAPRVRRGGRVVYFGAGTSGRLGVLDASECLPTFNSDQFIGIIAGGDTALRKAKEGIEDFPSTGAYDLASLSPRLSPTLDTCIGIASSGRTPYVLGALSRSHDIGCLTIAIVCVPNSEIAQSNYADHVICIETGPEVLTGSTRMKAGTATKLVLNMISTAVMIKIGKTYGNLMVDLKPTNHKLTHRAYSLIRSLTSSPHLSSSQLDTLLTSCSGSVKLAIIVQKLKISVRDAKRLLEENEGILERVIGPPPIFGRGSTALNLVEPSSRSRNSTSPNTGQNLFLCIDGGGTHTRAYITSLSQDTQVPYILASGIAGPSNVSVCGIVRSIEQIKLAIINAVDGYNSDHSEGPNDPRASQLGPEPGSTTKKRPIITSGQIPTFCGGHIGIAGLDPVTRPERSKEFTYSIHSLLNINVSNREDFQITSDVGIFGPLFIESPPSDQSIQPSSTPRHTILLLSGTGSISTLFSPSGTIVARSGGYGYLLSDEGSGFDIGRMAVKRVLASSSSVFADPDRDEKVKVKEGEIGGRLEKTILDHFGVKNTNELIDVIYHGSSPLSDSSFPIPISPTTPKDRLASLSPLILSLAYPPSPETQPDPPALQISSSALQSLISLLPPLLTHSSLSSFQRPKIVLTGGILRNSSFRSALRVQLVSSGYLSEGDEVRYIEEPAREVGLLLPLMHLKRQQQGKGKENVR